EDDDVLVAQHRDEIVVDRLVVHSWRPRDGPRDDLQRFRRDAGRQARHRLLRPARWREIGAAGGYDAARRETADPGSGRAPHASPARPGDARGAQLRAAPGG